MWRFFILLLLLSAVPAHARGNQGNETLCTLRVDVEFANKGLPASGLRVQLLQGFAGATPYQVGLTNSSGWAEFENLLPGDYRLEVSGAGIETVDSGNIHIENGKVFMSQLVVVRATENNGGTATGAESVSVRELDVPKNASEELVRGDEEMEHKNWKKAAEHFKKAVSIYPQYTSGYYDLSVAYYQMNQRDKQRAALQKALSIDGHFVPALVSMAHMEFADHKLPETRALLSQAIQADPTDVEALALLVRVDFLQGQYQQTIIDARRVHSLPHQGYATVHYSAAAAYQRLNNIPEMIDELKLFLKEDPTSPNANYVRQTIAALSAPSR